MVDNKFVMSVRKAFSSVHKDIQNMKAFFDKLNKKVDLIGEQVDILRRGMVNLSRQVGEGNTGDGEDVPPERPPGFGEAEEADETEESSDDLYSS